MCFLIGSAKMTSTSQLVYCRRQVATKIRSVNGNLRFAAAPTVLGISLGGTAVLKGLAEGGGSGPSGWVGRAKTWGLAWPYLGSPIFGQGFDASKAAVSRAAQVTDAFGRFAAQDPLQALILLRHTAGACRVQHRCQTNDPRHFLCRLAALASMSPNTMRRHFGCQPW